MDKEDLKRISDELCRASRTPSATLGMAEQLREIAHHIVANFPLTTRPFTPSENAYWAINCLAAAEEIYYNHRKPCEEALACLEEAAQILERIVPQLSSNDWRRAADKRREECKSGKKPERIG